MISFPLASSSQQQSLSLILINKLIAVLVSVWLI